MKNSLNLISIILLSGLLTTSCTIGKTTEQCKDDVEAYSFGRDMQEYTRMRGGGSLSSAIDEYQSGLGIYVGYDANNDCVKRGYSDAQDNKESPYN